MVEGGKLVMVCHDWGSIVGSRLASEAKELADRWILTSGVIVSVHSVNNKSISWSSTRKSP